MFILNHKQLFCITADNTSNNDTATQRIETILDRQNIHTFQADQHRLPCLAHVINLAIVAIMSELTKTAAAETAAAVWDFDPTLPGNQVLGDRLDVVAAIRTLTVKIQASDQRICYFNRLQKDCGIENVLVIPLHSKIRWGTADKMLEHAYLLRQVTHLLNRFDCALTENDRPSTFLFPPLMNSSAPLRRFDTQVNLPNGYLGWPLPSGLLIGSVSKMSTSFIRKILMK
jgi:hypothetical protein